MSDDLKRKVMNLTRENEAYRCIGNIKAPPKSARLTLLGTPFKSRIENDAHETPSDAGKENANPERKFGKPSRFANLGTPFGRKSKDEEEVNEGTGGISFMA